MKEGLHVIAQTSLADAQRAGADMPAPVWGILDLLRMLEGHDVPEPKRDQPLPVAGVDALIRARPQDPAPLLRAIRGEMVAGRQYLLHRRVPLVLLFEGELSDPKDDTGLYLNLDGRTHPLRPLLGTRLTPAHPNVRGWWWAPQIG